MRLALCRIVHVPMVERALRPVYLPHLSQRKAPMVTEGRASRSGFVALQPCAFMVRVSIQHLHPTGGGGGEAATRRNMRREERVTVQGPVKKQQPDGMSHRGGGGWWLEPPEGGVGKGAQMPGPLAMGSLRPGDGSTNPNCQKLLVKSISRMISTSSRSARPGDVLWYRGPWRRPTLRQTCLGCCGSGIQRGDWGEGDPCWNVHEAGGAPSVHRVCAIHGPSSLFVPTWAGPSAASTPQLRG